MFIGQHEVKYLQRVGTMRLTFRLCLKIRLKQI